MTASTSTSYSQRLTWTDLTQRATWPAIGAGIFLLLSVLVHLRLFAGIDLAVTERVATLGNDTLDALGEVIALAVSAEASLVYATLAAVLLWRAGRGRWSLAPFAFVLLEPIEFVGKIVVDQPLVPSEFYRVVGYPLTSVTLEGSFPSGHALRTAFFCVLGVVFLKSRGGRLARIGPTLCGFVALLAGFTRIYLGYHWLTDVIAGLILGASLGIFIAPAIASREEL